MCQNWHFELMGDKGEEKDEKKPRAGNPGIAEIPSFRGISRLWRRIAG